MDRYGYWNKILHVNLSDRSTWIEEPAISSSGATPVAGAHRPLSPEVRAQGRRSSGADNILVIAPGVLTGAPVPRRTP